jgi:uncharacterized membrane protein YphA (DoxX/SURF4 family)
MMNIALWVVAGLLALAFAGAGFMKLATPKEKLAQNPNMGWTQDFSAGLIKFIGAAEVAGALGLVLPQAFGIAEVLTPLAAVGLVVTMLGAIVTHVRRKENQAVIGPVVLGALAAFVAVGRF